MPHSNSPRAWAAAYHIQWSDTLEGCDLLLKDLEDDASLQAMLNSFANSVQSPAAQVTGSLLMKRYCLLIAGALHGFIRNRVAMDLSRERIGWRWQEPVLQFLVKSAAEEPDFLRGLKDDKVRRARYFDHLFAEQAGPVLRRLAQVTRIDEDTLWGTLSYSIAYWKNDWLQSAELTEEERERIEADFTHLYRCDIGSRFPDRMSSPLTDSFRCVDNPWDKAQPVLVRSKCCLHYCLPGKKEGHCYTCPKISDEKRLDKYAAAHGYIQDIDVVSTAK